MGSLAAGPHLAHGWLNKMGSSGVESGRKKQPTCLKMIGQSYGPISKKRL